MTIMKYYSAPQAKVNSQFRPARKTQCSNEADLQAEV